MDLWAGLEANIPCFLAEIPNGPQTQKICPLSDNWNWRNCMRGERPDKFQCFFQANLLTDDFPCPYFSTHWTGQTFNNQIRFNNHGEFNLPVGKRDFNKKIEQKLSDFIDPF